MSEQGSGSAGRRRRKAADGPTTSDAIDIAMDAVKHDRSLESPAREVLRKHGRLLDWQIASERLSVGLKLLTGAAGVAIAIALGSMVWSAAHSEGLVVEAFQTPPQDAARGLNGAVLASRVLDRIAYMDARSHSYRASSSYENNWGDDLKVEIAETGVSLSELQRFLRASLGHETRIAGELVREGDLLTLTVRTTGHEAFTVTGKPDDLDRMIDEAAEKLYGATQAYQFSKYLEYQGRPDEALAVAQQLQAAGPRSEQVWAWTQINNLLGARGEFAAARQAGEQAVRADPDNALAWVNFESADYSLGHEEASRRGLQKVVEAVAHGMPGVSEAARGVFPTNDAGLMAIGGDFIGAAEVTARAGAMMDFQGSSHWAPLQEAMYLAQAHQPSDSARLRRRAAAEAEDDLVGQVRWNAAPIDARLLELVDREDWAGVRAEGERLRAIGVGKGKAVEQVLSCWVDPITAEARARTGDLAGAQALVGTTPRDCYLAVRGRAKVAVVAGRPAEADAWFREATRQGPNLPLGWSEWGQAKAARGDLAGAIALFHRAEELGPRFADPLKYEGDALVRQGKLKEALRKYAAAADRTPRWGGLHLAWGRALERAGKGREALAKYALARRMDLSRAERTEVERRLAGR
jgi:tetratricopeptide (TPR) repeat protein